MGEVTKEPNEDTRDFIMLSLLTGARKMTVLSMRFSDIDWNSGTWTIQESQSKNGQLQVIQLTAIEVKLLKAREEKGNSDFVFPGAGKSGHLVDPKKSWSSLRKRAGLSDVTIHDLRRNLGSWMASQNVNVALIKGALNHKDMKTTISVYARTAKEAEREGRLKAHEAMFEAAGDVGKELLKEARNDLRPIQPKVKTSSRKTGVR